MSSGSFECEKPVGSFSGLPEQGLGKQYAMGKSSLMGGLHALHVEHSLPNTRLKTPLMLDMNDKTDLIYNGNHEEHFTPGSDPVTQIS